MIKSNYNFDPFCIVLRIIMRAQMSFSRQGSHRPLYTFCMNVQLFLPQKESTTPNSVKGVVSHRDQYPCVRYICQVKYIKQFVFKNNKQYIIKRKVRIAKKKFLLVIIKCDKYILYIHYII